MTTPPSQVVNPQESSSCHQNDHSSASIYTTVCPSTESILQHRTTDYIYIVPPPADQLLNGDDFPFEMFIYAAHSNLLKSSVIIDTGATTSLFNKFSVQHLHPKNLRIEPLPRSLKIDGVGGQTAIVAVGTTNLSLTLVNGVQIDLNRTVIANNMGDVNIMSVSLFLRHNNHYLIAFSPDAAYLVSTTPGTSNVPVQIGYQRGGLYFLNTSTNVLREDTVKLTVLDEDDTSVIAPKPTLQSLREPPHPNSTVFTLQSAATPTASRDADLSASPRANLKASERHLPPDGENNPGRFRQADHHPLQHRPTLTLTELHNKLNHTCGAELLMELVKAQVYSGFKQVIITADCYHNIRNCEVCMLGKMKKYATPLRSMSGDGGAYYFGQVLYIDCFHWDNKIYSYQGDMAFIAVTDKYSKFLWTHAYVHKRHVYNFLYRIIIALKESNARSKVIYWDQDSVFLEEKLQNFLQEDMGIEMVQICKDAHHQSIVENKGGHAKRCIRAMVYKMPPTKRPPRDGQHTYPSENGNWLFWTHILSAITIGLNMTASLPNGDHRMVPMSFMVGKRTVSLQGTFAFGSLCYIKEQTPLETEARVKKGMYLYAAHFLLGKGPTPKGSCVIITHDATNQPIRHPKVTTVLQTLYQVRIDETKLAHFTQDQYDNFMIMGRRTILNSRLKDEKAARLQVLEDYDFPDSDDDSDDSDYSPGEADVEDDTEPTITFGLPPVDAAQTDGITLQVPIAPPNAPAFHPPLIHPSQAANQVQDNGEREHKLTTPASNIDTLDVPTEEALDVTPTPSASTEGAVAPTVNTPPTAGAHASTAHTPPTEGAFAPPVDTALTKSATLPTVHEAKRLKKGSVAQIQRTRQRRCTVKAILRDNPHLAVPGVNLNSSLASTDAVQEEEYPNSHLESEPSAQPTPDWRDSTAALRKASILAKATAANAHNKAQAKAAKPRIANKRLHPRPQFDKTLGSRRGKPRNAPLPEKYRDQIYHTFDYVYENEGVYVNRDQSIAHKELEELMNPVRQAFADKTLGNTEKQKRIAGVLQFILLMMPLILASHLTPTSSSEFNAHNMSFLTKLTACLPKDPSEDEFYTGNKFTFMDTVPIPKHIGEALHPKNKYREEWKKAILEEWDSIETNKVWTWTHGRPPDSAKPLNCTWVFKVKEKFGIPVRFKARLCVRGDQQREHVDYDLLYSPVVKTTTSRVIFALAAANNWMVRMLDIKTAFLAGDLDNDNLYVRAPQGLAGIGIVPPNGAQFLKLSKSIYGLKQSPRLFNNTLKKHLTEKMGFKPIDADKCVFVKFITPAKGEVKRTYITCYVDDLNVLGNDREQIEEAVRGLISRFDIEDFGFLGEGQYLGQRLCVDSAKGEVTLDQYHYLKGVVNEKYQFDIDNYKPGSVGTLPKSKHCVLPKDADLTRSTPGELAVANSTDSLFKTKYQSVIGAFNYASTNARPDITVAVSKLQQAAHAPCDRHATYAKFLARYICGTIDKGLHYKKTGDLKKDTTVYGYTDSDWAGDKDSSRSTSAHVFYLCGAPICWMSKLQTTVALSSCEAEIISTVAAAREAIWLRQLLSELGFPQTEPTTILGDNAACLIVLTEGTQSTKLKHMKIKYHFVQDAVEDGEITHVKVGTDDNVADYNTKILEGPKAIGFRDQLVHEIPCTDTCLAIKYTKCAQCKVISTCIKCSKCRTCGLPKPPPKKTT